MLLFLPPGISSNQTTHHNKRRVSNSSRTSDGCLTDITRSHTYPRRQSMTECLKVSEDQVYSMGQVKYHDDHSQKLHISFSEIIEISSAWRNFEFSRLTCVKNAHGFHRRSISTNEPVLTIVSGNITTVKTLGLRLSFQWAILNRLEKYVYTNERDVNIAGVRFKNLLYMVLLSLELYLRCFGETITVIASATWNMFASSSTLTQTR
jgi:hypothetical protein